MNEEETKIFQTEETKPDIKESPKPVIAAERGLVAEPVKLALILILILAVSYLCYDKYRTENALNAEIAELTGRIEKLEVSHDVSVAAFASKVSDLEYNLESSLEQAAGSTKETIDRTAARLQAEGNKTRQELTQTISSRAKELEASVQATRTEADVKITQVNTEVTGVKEEVVTVRTDLENTRKDLEGTRRQLIDVRDTLNAAVAKNSAELAQLRLKGERDYYEFTIPDKKGMVNVGDIRLQLTKTDIKKGKYTVRVFVDDNRLEKKDRMINEPQQFLVGQDRLRYEVVINWVQKDSAGGYLSVPKDKTLSAERQ